MKTTAGIMREEIRSKTFETDVYATTEIAFNDISVVPETLKTFTDDVINKRKKDNTAAETRKCTVIKHPIIAATRPRSFLSTIQVGLSVYTHMHLASRYLIYILSSMSVCASYREARQYGASSAKLGDQHTISKQ